MSDLGLFPVISFLGEVDQLGSHPVPSKCFGLRWQETPQTNYWRMGSILLTKEIFAAFWRFLILFLDTHLCYFEKEENTSTTIVLLIVCCAFFSGWFDVLFHLFGRIGDWIAIHQRRYFWTQDLALEWFWCYLQLLVKRLAAVHAAGGDWYVEDIMPMLMLMDINKLSIINVVFNFHGYIATHRLIMSF